MSMRRRRQSPVEQKFPSSRPTAQEELQEICAAVATRDIWTLASIVFGGVLFTTAWMLFSIRPARSSPERLFADVVSVFESENVTYWVAAQPQDRNFIPEPTGCRPFTTYMGAVVSTSTDLLPAVIRLLEMGYHTTDTNFGVVVHHVNGMVQEK
mmetsp:Transcript_7847/g.23697  ORF Transcript_7847/g.23697 Transcript_7847/m.23697 type:complete len:154 (-) Transcript_7847:1168-1629(-)